MLPGGNHNSFFLPLQQADLPLTQRRWGGDLPQTGYLYSSLLCCLALVSLGKAQAGYIAPLGIGKEWGGCDTLQEFIVQIRMLWGNANNYTPETA